MERQDFCNRCGEKISFLQAEHFHGLYPHCVRESKLEAISQNQMLYLPQILCDPLHIYTVISDQENFDNAKKIIIKWIYKLEKKEFIACRAKKNNIL